MHGVSQGLEGQGGVAEAAFGGHRGPDNFNLGASRLHALHTPRHEGDRPFEATK